MTAETEVRSPNQKTAGVSPSNGGVAVTVSESSAPTVSQSDSTSRSLSLYSEDLNRGAWGGQIEFVLTCIGYAVGLGNVWRFPYLCYQNGGGAFLIPYFIVLIFVGVPMYFFEMSFGQFSSLGPITIWNVNPMFKGVGISMVIICAYIVCYYNIIVTWCLYYFFASMTKNLPWEFCGNWWNTDACVDRTMNVSQVIENITNGTDLKISTPAEEYYYNFVLRLSSGIDEPGTVVWQLALLLLLAWVIIWLVLFKGVASVGKVSYFVSLFPYVLLTVLLGQAATLDGALDGVKFYMTPDWDRLTDAQVWGDAAQQIFYSLGICMGSLIAMASFNKFRNDTQRDSIMIPIINCMTSVYAGFVVFTMLGYIAKQKNVPIAEVAKEGPGLVFVVYPEGLATLPVAPLWAVLFFFMMCTLGFSSQFSMAESVCAAIADEYPVLCKGRNGLWLRTGYCLINFLLGLPMITEGGFYLFYICDLYTASYTLFFTAILEIMAIAWIYDYRRFAADIEIMLGRKTSGFWIACWVGISPIIIIGIIVLKALNQSPLTFGEYVYPTWANALAWLIVAFPLVILFGWMIGRTIHDGGDKICVKVNQPATNWGPAHSADRKGTRYGNKVPEQQLGDAFAEPSISDKDMFSITKRVTPPPAYEVQMNGNMKTGVLNPGFSKHGEIDLATYL